ncbi:hypothetical protein M413DRAFT_13109 [Hebeloma cylindrosporum]|uniref:Uncharacterized protein n=1 Tax=Hebeloma cylindrosporum TaxID=76867 RepID=A0A0C3C2S8_HEBCY|nr:hypothetical protein M413DRAFT_13109 [Hebeloma cylindrosporum h7]
MAPRTLSDDHTRNGVIGHGDFQSFDYRNQGTPPPRMNGEESDRAVRGQLFALTIGINEYQSPQYRNLSGCLADADGINEYLQAVLSVNPRNITSLRNATATRENILLELKSFIDNPKIQHGDPILIYFSWTWGGGEGASGMDYDQFQNSDTVILDNCFSGSGTRTSQYDLRGVQYRLQLPYDLDEEHAYKAEPISPTRALNVAPGFLHGGFKSHILISACGAEERAREFCGHGVFTDALLKALQRWRSHGVQLERLTYKDLLDLVGELPGQNPQCEGDHQDRFVFNAKVPHCPRISYTGSVNYEVLNLDAGSAHGITTGSKILVWKDLESYYLEEALAEVSINKVHLYNSEATAPPILPHGTSFVAQHVSLGDRPELKVHVRDEASKRMVHDAIRARELADNVMKPMNIALSPIEEGASVIISTAHDDRITFDFIDSEINRRGLKRLPHTAPQEAVGLQRIIHAISHHLYHLRFPKIPVDEDFSGKISLKVFKAKVYDDEPPTIIGDNLNIDGQGIDLEMDGSAQIIIIENDTEFDIYPALFYFESIDLSITPVYLPPTAGHNKVDPPLRAKQSLTIGCGTGSGGVPHVFENDGTGCIELGFLKLYIMSQAVDLCNIAQQSPFGLVEVARPSPIDRESAFEHNTRATKPWVPSQTFDFLQTIIVPVVVRDTPRTPPGNTSSILPTSNAHHEPPQFKSMWNKTVRSTISYMF